ncbi:MAG: hypothetical protein QW331_00230 [Candidatus Woesearchaeota archaeon]
MAEEDLKEFKKKYLEKLETRLGEREKTGDWKQITSKDYMTFKEEYLPKNLTRYEKLCQISEKIFKVSPDPKKRKDIEEAIETIHLNATPEGVTGFSFLGPIFIAFVGGITSFLIFGSFFMVAFFLILSVALYPIFSKFPFFLAQNWRLKASNQMVLCIFYLVTYMRHTSNLERAIGFAAEHLDPPISIDLKKVLWDVETGKYENIKMSVDRYLEGWKKYNMEFIEAFHLIESSLFEGSEKRRVELLDKSLDIILTGTYEKMLHYAQDLKGPITMLHMMGVILPILGLVILPLVVSFLTDKETSPTIVALYIAFLYNLLLPIGVYYIGKNILAKRPTGYGETDISENPEIKKRVKKIKPKTIAITVAFILIFIGLLPTIIHLASPEFDLVIPMYGDSWLLTQKEFEAYRTNERERPFMTLLEYRMPQKGGDEKIGPYGLGAALLSLLLILGIALGFGLYYKLKTSNLIKIRNETKALEKEFAAALFQLGNKLADGIPVEIAFAKIAENMKETRSGEFFSIVVINMRKLGMGVERAIFDPQQGALVYFPSKLIESSMKVLVESARKGPSVAAAALINVSEYIKEIHRVEERLKDLLSEIISSMKSQISILTPAIAGIVVGITSMIVTILGALSANLKSLGAGTAEVGAVGTFADLFGDGVPTHHFQIIVGLYVVQITYILSIIQNGVENGNEKLSENYLVGNNLVKSTVTYALISTVVMFIFNFVAAAILKKTGVL